MADNSIRLVAVGDSSDDSDEKYEIYEAGSDMLCVIGLDNPQSPTKTQSRLKPKYKQSYREAWESMRDFKGWLTSVPGNNTKAYCKLCKKELHCHRLSLLKHKVTYKHHKKEEEQRLIKLFEEKNETNSQSHIAVKEESVKSIVVKEEHIDDYTEGEKMSSEDASPPNKTIKSDSCDSLTHEKQEEIQSNDASLTTHVLDISRGVPAASVHVVLYKLIDGRWTLISEGLTDAGGRYNSFLTNQTELTAGRYKLHFDVDKYFERQNQETIFPFIEVVFDVKDVSTNYHIPLLLSPFGYNAYRGS